MRKNYLNTCSKHSKACLFFCSETWYRQKTLLGGTWDTWVPETGFVSLGNAQRSAVAGINTGGHWGQLKNPGNWRC